MEKKFASPFNFRNYRSGDWFLEQARSNINYQRTVRATAETRFIPSSTVNLNEVKDAINLAIAGFRKRPESDAYWMTKWLRNSRQDGFVDPCVVPLKELFPLGAPLIDHLRVDTERLEGWAFPPTPVLNEWRANRGIPSDYPQAVEVREFVLGKNSDDDLVEMDRWIRKNWEEDQHTFPSTVLSFDTEQVPITHHDWIAMSKEGARDVALTRNQKLASSLILNNSGYTEQDYHRNLPGKIFFGDGIKWTAVFSLPFKRVEGRIVISARKISPIVAEFFNN
ncbi:MAG: hypothetical protein AAFO91_14015, partial [Bacteroidota bacterium]